ncbi:MAG: hypothetical protein R2568_02440 [Candidatus Scalindua sp.]|nr:hypothetical protein [Candidatus Scalindua sp.]MDV5165589.1 hypothetical protein [Candidatus Scalindua sp.]
MDYKKRIEQKEFIGIFLLLSSIGGSSWWITKHGTHKGTVVTMCFLAVFAGLALILSERITELSMKGVGTIKAAAKSAQTDANEIAGIRKRVEAQAATMDLVATESAEAKQLLVDLTEQNEVADRKLKELAERTSEVVRLPDGRTKFGNIITGAPSALQKKMDAGLAAYRQNDFSAAHVEFAECIRLYEESKDQEGNVAMISGRVNVDAVATVSALAAETALRTENHDSALKYARKSVALTSTPEREALLAVCLLKNGNVDEVDTMLSNRQKKNDDASKKFIKALTNWGVIKHQSNKATNSDKEEGIP